ncbi:4-alpha-glucanotransferase [Paraburkholderia bonniea]|uniref:4-alpha-glucanotransferase n=1 Tax=Paraburkholderia bonniea TaxID=2152891 RepID=UPI00257245FA|nr:4-alpha-glucanotransferase [Paraburkholderia bonniea]WJF91704.1 4-alpha-glucanotransferase [Paraburkholderia bonniea]WJF95024.1 4-alpha-glucanotransferase [Paraburkholderia bonniea]
MSLPNQAKATLDTLAEHAGLQLEWEDAQHVTHRVSPDTLACLLEQLGLPCRSNAQIRQSSALLAAEHHHRHLPPLLTAECERGIALPPNALSTGSRYQIELESGTVIDGRFTVPKGESALLAPVSEPGYHTLVWHEQRVTLAVAPARAYTVADAWRATGDMQAPPPLWGLSAQLYGLRRDGGRGRGGGDGDGRGNGRGNGRGDGRGDGDGGIGDYTALAELASHSARHGAHALAVSPTHAMFSALAQNFSPYSPSSRLWLNVLHIDPAALFGTAAVHAALDTLHAHDAWARCEAQPLLDWTTAATLRLKVLRLLFERFCASASATERAALDAFRTRGGQALQDHARFEALQAFHLAHGASGDWHHWSAALRDPRQAAVTTFAHEHPFEVEFHLFLQWLAAQGLDEAQRRARADGMALGLIADLAVGCDGTGSHAWACGSEMLDGVSIGAPPDPMNQLGQAWGLTTFSPRAMRHQGFAGFIDLLRASFAHAGGVRIDHILGLRRLWLVPQGASAIAGAYLRYPLEDLLRLITLESWRHRAVVIGEDLGTVPAGFRQRLAAHGIAGIRTLWLERSEPGPGFLAPEAWGHEAIATTTTHDLPTLAGWWAGRDIAWRSECGQLPERVDGQDAAVAAQAERAQERAALWGALRQAGMVLGAGHESVSGSGHEPMPGSGHEPMPKPLHEPSREIAHEPAHETAPALARDDDETALPRHAPIDAALAFVASTPAPLALFPLEDLLGLVEQPNLPGTVDHHPNWRRRLNVPVGALFEQPEVARRLVAIRRWRRG